MRSDIGTTAFRPSTRPLGLPPYRYSLIDNFPTIGTNIEAAQKMGFHVLGDSGGVQDGEFQSNVAEQMVEQIAQGGPAVPQFCYHIGDVVYFTGMNADYSAQFYEP